ncbi:MAG: hypothetical protein M3R55_14240 [Acidobacteriota bacterium]|nr:hypothetical protein [Acidobacteriota bacterium]
MRMLIARKYAASFLKKTWDLEDYPVEVWQKWRGFEAPEEGPAVFVARIVGWPSLLGTGESAEAAHRDLARQFAGYKSTRAELPRPGTIVAREPGEPPSDGAAEAYDDHLISGAVDLDDRR